MPVEFSPLLVRRTLADLRADDREAAIDVEGALEWLGVREGGGDSLVLSRYELQRFVWDGLPQKWLISVEEKLAVLEAFAGFLDRVGAAPAYGAVCRSEDTRALIELWETDRKAARARLQELLRLSGLEPPDTPALSWGSVMGVVEARALDEAALRLELAVEDAQFDPGEPGFERHQAKVVEAFLSEPSSALDGRTRLALICEERIERWARSGGEARREILGRVVDELSEPASTIAVSEIETTLDPLVWLLGLAADGVALTQTGALNRALVRAGVERYPQWWHDFRGEPNREDEVGALAELHQLARSTRLLRRRGQKLFLTTRGKALRTDPPALLGHCAENLISAQPFEQAVGELTAALLLAEKEPNWDVAAARIYTAIVGDGWNVAGRPPDARDVKWIFSDFIQVTRALDLVRLTVGRDEPMRVAATDVGRVGLRLALRARASMPSRMH